MHKKPKGVKPKKIGIVYVAPKEDSSPEEDRRILAEFVNLVVTVGYREMKKVEREYEAFKRGEGVLSDTEFTKEYVKFLEEQEQKTTEK